MVDPRILTEAVEPPYASSSAASRFVCTIAMKNPSFVVFAAPVSQKRETRNQRHCITFSPGLTIVFPWQSLSARNACRIFAFLL